MNAERFHVIAKAIKNDLAATKTEATLQELINALTNQINSPQQAAFQQQVAALQGNIYNALDEAPSNLFSPAWRQVVEALRIERLLGSPLRERIQVLFSKNALTPAVALQELQQVLRRVGDLRQALDQVLAAFEYFEIGSEELAPGECEVGVLVPRAYLDDQLPKFIDELGEIERILGVFSELAIGNRPSPRIKTLSSSDLTIYLAAVPAVAAVMATAAERVLALYKQFLEVRKLRAELQKQGVPEKKLESINEHANSIIDSGIGTIVADLLKQHLQGDDGRRNELSIELTVALRKIANRVDNGFGIEVRAGPPPEKETGSEAEQASAEADAQHVAAIAEASKGLQFLKLDGRPLLSLPEGEPPASKKKHK